MHIEKVSYQRTFNLSNFNSERIGVDFILHQGEDEVTALDNAKRIVEETHKRFHPNLEVSAEPKVDQILSKEEITANNLAEIERCTTLEELKTLKLISKAGKQEFEAFMEKTKELTKNM